MPDPFFQAHRSNHTNSPGVHWLQDPRSRVYNFTPWLQKIPKVNDFAFERLTGFVKSSRDEVNSQRFLTYDY